MAVALYPFTADGDDELSVIEGEQLLVLQKDGDEWWKCRNAEGAEGVVAASYIELAPSNRQTAPRSTPLEEEPEEEEEKEDLAAKEAQPREKAETEAAAAAAAKRARKEEDRRRERIRKKRERRGRRKREQRLLRPSGPRGRRLQPLAILRLHLHQPTTVSSRSSPNKDRPSSSSGRTFTKNGFRPADRVRIWHDRRGQFRVEAALLSFKHGKLRNMLQSHIPLLTLPSFFFVCSEVSLSNLADGFSIVGGINAALGNMSEDDWRWHMYNTASL
ncbi:hypothetical protein F5877DRAFT_73407 [Lentinula edodes]|nr:hypothetical protein F5877DRAFT_73407 [Lentinula edodes]